MCQETGNRETKREKKINNSISLNEDLHIFHISLLEIQSIRVIIGNIRAT